MNQEELQWIRHQRFHTPLLEIHSSTGTQCILCQLDASPHLDETLVKQAVELVHRFVEEEEKPDGKADAATLLTLALEHHDIFLIPRGYITEVHWNGHHLIFDQAEEEWSEDG